MNAKSAGASKGGLTTTEGSVLAVCPMYANPGGGLLSGKLLYMDNGMVGGLGTVGTRGGAEGCQSWSTVGRGLYAWSL